MTDDRLLPFNLPAVRRKKVRAAFDDGLISCDSGLVLLREAEHCLGLADLLARCIRDRRDPALITHKLVGMMRLRMFAIACGYEDGDEQAVSSHPARATTKVGGDTSKSNPTLNPLFVETLMGWPTGWIGFGSAATAWSHWLPRMRGELSRLGSTMPREAA